MALIICSWFNFSLPKTLTLLFSMETSTLSTPLSSIIKLVMVEIQAELDIPDTVKLIILLDISCKKMLKNTKIIGLNPCV